MMVDAKSGLLMKTTFAPGWYAVLPSKKLKHKPLAVEAFGLNLVLWRTSAGRISCMLDKCPHRGAKLSLGKIQDGCITCPYHGFKFAANGECAAAPEFDRALPGVRVAVFYS